MQFHLFFTEMNKFSMKVSRKWLAWKSGTGHCINIFFKNDTHLQKMKVHIAWFWPGAKENVYNTACIWNSRSGFKSKKNASDTLSNMVITQNTPLPALEKTIWIRAWVSIYYTMSQDNDAVSMYTRSRDRHIHLCNIAHSMLGTDYFSRNVNEDGGKVRWDECCYTG